MILMGSWRKPLSHTFLEENMIVGYMYERNKKERIRSSMRWRGCTKEDSHGKRRYRQCTRFFLSVDRGKCKVQHFPSYRKRKKRRHACCISMYPHINNTAFVTQTPKLFYFRREKTALSDVRILYWCIYFIVICLLNLMNYVLS